MLENRLGPPLAFLMEPKNAKEPMKEKAELMATPTRMVSPI